MCIDFFNNPVFTALAGALAAISGACVAGYFGNRQMNKQLTRIKEEADKQRSFTSEHAKEQFILQQKICAYEFSLKVLPEYPRTVEQLQKAWAASSLLQLYLPDKEKKVADEFDLKGVDIHSIDIVRKTKWSHDYDKLKEILRKEIEKLSDSHR